MRSRPILAALSSLALFACGEGSSAPDAGATPPGAPSAAGELPPAAAPAQDAAASRFAPGGPIADAELAGWHAALEIEIDGQDAGTLTLELWPQFAPITVRNFLRLCDEGFYDGVRFHRILREFMVQGGDPTGTGEGDSPHGTIVGEFSDDPGRAHRYGVISMARVGGQPDSASCQFFLCCAESPSVWNLDGQYASFGKLTGGVGTLEALADVQVTMSPSGEVSTPTQDARIKRARAVEGAAPRGGTIERPHPEPDLGGAPRAVKFRHVLIAFEGAARSAQTRTQEEAAALAQQVLERARAGEDFEALMSELSDDPVNPYDPFPGVQSFRNAGVRDVAGERRLFETERDVRQRLMELDRELGAGALSQEQVEEQRRALVAAYREAEIAAGLPREQTLPGVADTAFALEVGEFGVCPYDAERSPFGFHVLERLE